MLKYVFAGLFILILSGLFQHPVPILEDVEVYSERKSPEEIIEEPNTMNKQNDNYLPQAKVEIQNSESTDYQLLKDKNTLVSVTPHTY